MSEMFSNQPVDRRTALMTLVSAGAGILAAASPLSHASDDHGDSLVQILPDFTAESRAKLRAILSGSNFSGQIPAAIVHELATAEKKNVSALMLALLPLARTFSHPPISNYRVGIVARGASGSLYLGFNIEIPGQALGFAVHGEQSALSSAYMHAEAGVSAIALTAAPCGHCRQFMNELAPDGELDIFVKDSAPTKLAALLPLAFGPKDLGRNEGAFPVRETNLAATTATNDVVARAALDAARKSYAPYSGAHSGVAIATHSGKVHKGSYIENVAFNPSLSPLQTALVQMILAGEDYAAISRVALAEMKEAKISQRAATEAVLSAIAPSVRVEFVAAERKA